MATIKKRGNTYQIRAISTVICSKRHRRERAKQSQRRWYLTKRKSRALIKPSYLRKDQCKDHFSEIKTK